MPSRVLLFTGAPLSASLDWKHSGLLENFTEPFSRFLVHEKAEGAIVNTPAAVISTYLPAWRYIPLERQHLTTGQSQNNGWQEEYVGASFFTTDSFIEEMSQILSQSRASIESAEQYLSQFYERSYAVHEDIASSQLGPLSVTSNSSTNESSYRTTQSSIDSPQDSTSRPSDLPIAAHLANLISIPNAAYLSSIYPQTLTVDLIIGIISIPAPRPIRTRRGANVDLVEILVGDETKSGFGINFWLSSTNSPHNDLRSTLTRLRPQDVILVQNVALDSFQGKVYGQSLRKNLTKIYLLYRNRIDKTDLVTYYKASDFVSTSTLHPQLEKISKVRNWVMKFVGGPGKGNDGFEEMKETLPPDTQ
ncbi:hypothetical protein B0O99DRAFT_682359 [Bisporella sp. PMI_857]|nr:hypothetical protein B0O99DRAFT_682359 [Bisporella sp. PMI_857]